MKKNTKIKEILKSLAIFAVIASIALMITTPALAQNVEETIGQIGQQAGYNTEQAGHSEASYEPGASTITSAIYFVVDLFKYIIGTIAVVVIIASGVRLVTATKQIEEISSQQKENIKYALIGLIIVVVTDVMVKQVFFGEAGEVYRSVSDAQMAAERGTEQIRGIYNFIEIFIGVLAIFMIITAGIRLVTSAGNEETITKSKKQIMWAILGIVLVGISELLVKDIVFTEQGEKLPDLARARKLIVDLTNFVSAFVATVAIAYLMYGGYLYVTSAGREDSLEKAKKVLFSAVLGIIFALGAFALVNTFIKFEVPT